MVSSDIANAAASGLLFISNLLSTVKIEKLDVPELVQKGNVSSVVLDCDYNVHDVDFSVQWLFNRDDTPVYEWLPPKDPIVRGVLENRLDLGFKISNDPLKEHRAIKILQPDESLSGEYTCIVKNAVSEARERGHMLVFSPQQELSIDWHNVWDEVHQHRHEVEVTCTAKGVYPQPNLLLEKNHVPVNSQEQKIWRNGVGGLFDAQTTARYRHSQLRSSERFTCKLDIPDAGYVAINEKIIVFRNVSHNALEYKSKKELDYAAKPSKGVRTHEYAACLTIIIIFLTVW